MLKASSIIVIVCTLAYAGAACAKGPTFYPQLVPLAIDTAAFSRENETLFRVSLAAADEIIDQQVSVGNVTICSDIACYRPVAPHQQVSIYTTRSGTAAALPTFIVPTPMTIKSVHFDGIAGAKTVAGDITLDVPLTLERNVHGGELLVLVSREKSGERTTYRPSAVASNLFSPFRKSVFYYPRFSTQASLERGNSMFIPAGATKSPQIFSVAVHDTGSQFPLIDIFPAIQLLQRGSFSTMVGKGTGDASARPSTPEVPTTRVLPATGVIDFGASILTETRAAAALSTATSECVSLLNVLNSRITSNLTATGTIYIPTCENIAPFVHIAISNNMDSRARLSLTYEFAGNGSFLNLQRIETWGANSQVMLNGFTWSGDSGAGPGRGMANGFVQNDENSLGNNKVGGGLFGTNDGNKLAFSVSPRGLPLWKEGSATPLWIAPMIPPLAISSSSTSVVKAGICSGDSTRNKWSAFGTTPSGRMIFMSSTSSGSTSAAELCPVFQALGADFAIRLDGSTAAGMMIDGRRKNPITGSSTFFFGSSRNIAYALRVGYYSGAPGPTPIVTEGRVTNPRNPCVVNPASCR